MSEFEKRFPEPPDFLSDGSMLLWEKEKEVWLEALKWADGISNNHLEMIFAIKKEIKELEKENK